MLTAQEKKAKLIQLLSDPSKVDELYQRIGDLSKQLEDTKAKLDSIDKKKTELLRDS